MSSKIRIAMIGCGIMAGWHIREIMKHASSSEIVAICEPSEAAYSANARLFVDAGLEPPPNQPDLARLLAEHAVDTAFIITPHVHHHDQTVACLEAGLDVLLEKPMVMSQEEAESLIAAQERTGRLLVVAFPGGMSPRIRKAVEMLRSGELGRLLSISATVWQDWGAITTNTWRQVPQLAGGGFLFDTGAHMLNTVADLAGQELAEVAAWLEDNGRPVETMGAVIGRLESGVMVTMHACGEAIPPVPATCASSAHRPSCAPGSGASGWICSAPAPGNCDRSKCRCPPGSGSSSWPCAAAGSPTPAHPRWACAWPGCTMQSRRRRRKVGSRCISMLIKELL
jgi:predicted dehydrogenase